MAVPGALIFQERALAGGQLEEPLADAVRTALSSAIANDAPPLPVFASTDARLRYLRWLLAKVYPALHLLKEMQLPAE